MQHRSAPNNGFVAGIEQAHRNHFDALRLHGNDVLVGCRGRFLLRAEHDGDVGPVDVSIEQTNFVAEFREREREIHGDGRFSDTAFAAGHGDKIFHAGNRMALWHLLRCWGHECCPSRIEK